MSQVQPEVPDWPVLIGWLLKAKQEINERDPEKLQPFTNPRLAATEAEIVALEGRIGERIDEHYRNFLLHANGWPNVYFNLGFFGIEEFDGGGNWDIVNELLAGYDVGGQLSDTGLDVRGVMPIAAGEGMRDLIVIAREGWKAAGTVVWVDGGEIHREENFTEFFKTLINDAQEDAAELAADSEGT